MADCDVANIDATGRIKEVTQDFIDLGFFLTLKCLVDAKIGMCTIYYYPNLKLISSEPENVERVVDICTAAEHVNVKLLPIKDVTPTHIAFIKETERIKAVMYKYLAEVAEIPSVTNGNASIIHYIYGMLFGYSEAEIRGYYLRRYVLIDANLPGLDEIDTELTPDEYYSARYDLIKD